MRGPGMVIWVGAGLIAGCASQKEYQLMREQNFGLLTRIDELQVSMQQTEKMLEEYRGALAAATAMIRELQQRNEDAEHERRENERSLAELRAQLAECRRKANAYEAQLTAARDELRGLHASAGRTSASAEAGSSASAPAPEP